MTKMQRTVLRRSVKRMRFWEILRKEKNMTGLAQIGNNMSRQVLVRRVVLTGRNLQEVAGAGHTSLMAIWEIFLAREVFLKT